MLAGRLGLALVLAALCLGGGRTAHAQAAPVGYWLPGWPMGFGNTTAGQNSSTYGNFPSFDGRDAAGGGVSRYNFSNGWFIGSEAGGMGLSGLSQSGAFSNAPSLSYQGMQLGYNFQNSPLKVYAGFDTLKYNTGIGSPFASFDSNSGNLPGYSAHAGVEFQPTSNVSLSLGFGYTQQPRIDNTINSLTLSGASAVNR